MSSFLLGWLRVFLDFGKNSFGLMNNSYVTARKLVYGHKDYRSLFFLYLFILSYFVFASLVRVGLGNPYILTFHFNLMLFGAVAGFIFSYYGLIILGRIFTATEINKEGFFLLWSYSYLPTLMWFFFTSVFYLLLPPPRTLSYQGKAFSIMFIALSLVLLFWKIVIYYLSLRFGMKLDLTKIVFVSVIFFPAVFLYSLLMYRLGIFRVPFI
jgi:hypothetical protein